MVLIVCHVIELQNLQSPDEETPGVFHPSAMSSPRDRDKLQRYLNAGSTLTQFVNRNNSPIPCQDVDDNLDTQAVLHERLTGQGLVYEEMWGFHCFRNHRHFRINGLS